MGEIVELMRPMAVATVPQPGDMPGGARYEVKLDGYRAACIVDPLSGEARLQSRQGRDMTARFPYLAAALAQVGPGTILDGELVASANGRMDFSALQKFQPGRPAPAGVSLSYVAFDLLVLGGENVRARPLVERVALLAQVLDGLGPQIQPVLSTGDRPTALLWMARLVDSGVEGLLIKGLSTTYNPRHTRSWRKCRTSETLDARLIGVVGSVRRPVAVVLEMDGRPVVTSPRLDGAQATAVAAAVHGRTGRPEFVPLLDLTVIPVADGPVAEVRAGHGRHATRRFVRLRSGD